MRALLAFSLLTAVASEDVTARYKVATRRSDDVVKAQSEGGVTTFDIKSPSGIGRAAIERKDDAWPKTVALRLHLKGLENVRISNGKTELAGAIAIRNGKVELRLWKDEKEEAPLDDKSPLWIKASVVGNDAPTIPLKQGAFELTLPPAFFADNPKSISVHWIDFYR